MTRWTQDQLDDYTERRRAAIKRYSGHTLDDLADTFQPDEGPESRLQSKIVAWCKEWGRPYLSFRQSRAAKGFLQSGWPDLTIIMPQRVVFIELKSGKGGRLSQEQKDMAIMFMHSGHTIHECRSYRQFIQIIQGGSES